LALDQLKLIQAAFRGDVIPKNSPQAPFKRSAHENTEPAMLSCS
jgi:hypothetical protein